MEDEDPQVLGRSPIIKVYNSMCQELRNVMDRIICIIPAIESARPGSTMGIQKLCSLKNAVEKARLLIQHCAMSSKLYLAITGEAIVSRCNHTRDAMHKSLSAIQDMVLETLAMEVLSCLGNAKFDIDIPELEAGKALRLLLRQTKPSEHMEFEAFITAASSLKLTTSEALMEEEICIRNQLYKRNGSNPTKRKILNYLLHLVTNYGNSGTGRTSHCDSSLWGKNCMPTEANLQGRSLRTEDQSNSSNTDVPPKEFKCPISSKIMKDPVIIASGQTYERSSIEKWFSDTCPQTKMKLSNLSMTPNSSIKDLISDWRRKHNTSSQNPGLQLISPITCSWSILNSSSATFDFSLNSTSSYRLEDKLSRYIYHSDRSNISTIHSDAGHSNHLSHVNDMKVSIESDDMFIWSDDYRRCKSFSNFTGDSYMGFLSQLSELSIESHGKALEDLKREFSGNDGTCHLMLSNGFLESLMRFLKFAYHTSHEQAQETGKKVLLAFMSNIIRNEKPSSSDDASMVLKYFLNSEITAESLTVIHMLCHHPDCQSTIVASGISESMINILSSRNVELLELCIKILCRLSSISEIKSQLLTSGSCISNLVMLLRDEKFAGDCLRILHSLCDTEEGTVAIAKVNGCIASIATFLESRNHEDKANALAILHSFCSPRLQHYLLDLKEDFSSSLVDIAINGNLQEKESSMKLLCILSDIRQSDHRLENLSLSSFQTTANSNTVKKQRTSTAFFGFRCFGR